MKERVNSLLYNLSLVLLAALLIWYFIAAEATFAYILTVMIVSLVVIEVISLVLVSKGAAESHISFKVGVIAGLCILLGIKSMWPAFFAPLTLALIAVNLVYNFYSAAKRKKPVFGNAKGKRTRS